MKQKLFSILLVLPALMLAACGMPDNISETTVTYLPELTEDTAALEVYRPDGTVTLEVTWDAAPQEEQAQDQPVQQQPSNGSGGYGDRNDGNGGYYGDPFDMFRYFFG